MEEKDIRNHETINELLRIIELEKKQNKQLQEEVETLENIVGIRDKRHLIAKFNKEYQNEYLSKTDRRDIAGVTPDAEKVYELYYQQKDTIKELQDMLNSTKTKVKDWLYRNCDGTYDSLEEANFIYDAKPIELLSILDKKGE